MKLLLISVGSRVGQNILDALEYPGLSRRSLVQIIGTNSVPDAFNNFRCDRCYLVPPTAAEEFPARIQDILRKESPDLIFCCRDDDTFALSQLKSKHPDLPGALPVGRPQAALIALDKWQTFLFASKHQLPFAESFMPEPSGDGAALEAFCRRVGYPLIAKPARGHSSLGVCFVRNAGDAQTIAQKPGYVLQEYIGDPNNLEPYFASLQGPPPLFTEMKGAGFRVCHTLIAPDGKVTLLLITENHTSYGRGMIIKRVTDTSLGATALNFARAIYLEGGVGSMGLQLRQNRDGAWKPVEINLRTAGVRTHFLFGVDEIGLLINAFVPGASFPELHFADSDRCNMIVKQSYSLPIFDSDISILQDSGVWSRS
jgi:hypothetical protein